MAGEKTNRGGPHGPGGAPRGGFQKPKHIRKTVSRLLGYLTRRKLPLVVVVLSVVVSSVCAVGGSYYLRPLINNFIDTGLTDLPAFGFSVLKLGLIYLCASVATYIQAAIMVQLAQRGCNRLRKDLFDRLQQLPLSYFDGHTHGELMSRFTNDADNVQQAMEQSVISLFSSALMFVGIIAGMLYINPLLFLVTLATLVATMLVIKFLGGRSRVCYAKQQAALGAVNGSIQETIEGLKVVKAFHHENQSQQVFDGLNATYRDAAMDANFYSTAIMPVVSNIFNIGFAVTAALGGALAVASGFDLGGLAAYLQFSKQVGQPLNQVSQQITTLLSALAGAERIFELMDVEPEPDDGVVTLVPVVQGDDGEIEVRTDGGHPDAWAWKCVQGPHGSSLVHGYEKDDGTLVSDVNAVGWIWQFAGEDGCLTLGAVRGPVRGQGEDRYVLIPLQGDMRLMDVSFSYVPDKLVLNDVSVYAKPGQKIAFVGSTGAGKTTITNLLNRFYEIPSGAITYDGIDVKNIRKDDLRHSLGVVLQDTHLFTGTVMENIRYGRLDATDEECVAAAKSANAHSFIRRLPQGYDTMISGDGGNLSQGQRQLLAIARAAVADPPVMILDEATSSIDTRTEQLIQNGMDTLMEGRTVFVIAHRLSTVRNASAIAVIEAGQIIEKGSHDELLSQQGRYYQLYTGQFQLS